MRANISGLNDVGRKVMSVNSSDLKIPKEFEVVILKMFSEIESIKLMDVESIIMYNPMTFDPIEKFRVHLELNFKEGVTPRYVREEYSKEISNLFTYTFNEYDFVSFHVDSFNIPPVITNKEKFFKLFS
jgi:hypothetical protein